MKKRLEIVEVRWADIVGYGTGWREAEDVAAMTHADCRTVGYLWKRKTVRGVRQVVVVGTVTGDHGVSDINVIPEGCIIETKVLGSATVDVPAKGQTPQ